MDMLTRPQGISLPLAPLFAGSIALAIATVIGTLPPPLFEGMIAATGLPAIVAAAEAPLGLTARLVVGVALALLVAATAYAPLSLYYGRRRLRVKRPAIRMPAAPVTAPAPKPRPIAAHQELGAPFLSVTAGAEPERLPPLIIPPRAPLDNQPRSVTEMVELADGSYIADRRRHPRDQRLADPVFDAAPTVPNLLKRLELAASADRLGPLGRRPLDPAFRAAVARLEGMRRA